MVLRGDQDPTYQTHQQAPRYERDLEWEDSEISVENHRARFTHDVVQAKFKTQAKEGPPLLFWNIQRFSQRTQSVPIIIGYLPIERREAYGEEEEWELKPEFQTESSEEEPPMRTVHFE